MNIYGVDVVRPEVLVRVHAEPLTLRQRLRRYCDEVVWPAFYVAVIVTALRLVLMR